MTGTAALIARIVMRYIALPVLIFLGVGPEAASQIVADPDILQLLVALFGVVAAGIEGWTWWARKHGGRT